MLLISLVFVCGCGRSDTPKVEKLSELSDEKLVEYLISLGLRIPEGCDDSELNKKHIRLYVEKLEEDPDWNLVISAANAHMLFLRTKVVVSKFYGHDDIAKDTQSLIDYDSMESNEKRTGE